MKVKQIIYFVIYFIALMSQVVIIFWFTDCLTIIKQLSIWALTIISILFLYKFQDNE